MENEITSTVNGRRVRIHLWPFDGLACGDIKGKEQYDKADIYLPRGFRPDRCTMETLIHELLHCSNWDASEEKVDRTGREIARVLWRLYKPR